MITVDTPTALPPHVVRSPRALQSRRQQDAARLTETCAVAGVDIHSFWYVPRCGLEGCVCVFCPTLHGLPDSIKIVPFRKVRGGNEIAHISPHRVFPLFSPAICCGNRHKFLRIPSTEPNRRFKLHQVSSVAHRPSCTDITVRARVTVGTPSTSRTVHDGCPQSRNFAPLRIVCCASLASICLLCSVSAVPAPDIPLRGHDGKSS